MSTPNPQEAASIAQHFIEPSRPHPSTSSPSLISQMSHRVDLVSFWGIKPGSRVLEIGCGQGDTTVVLADAVGEHGFVDAIDKGALDYGSPSTLGQAQAHIKSSPVGSRIQFHTPTDPIEYLSTYTGPKYDYAVLSHSIYYFSSSTTLPSLLTSLTPHISTLCIAEWSLSPSLTHPLASIPHILATILNTHLESRRLVEGDGNIRTVLSPSQIKNFVLVVNGEEGKGNWRLEKEVLVEVGEMRDAEWEVRDLLKEGFKEDVLGELFSSEGEREVKERVVAEAMFDALSQATEAVGCVGNVRCMRAWSGVFVME